MANLGERGRQMQVPQLAWELLHRASQFHALLRKCFHPTDHIQRSSERPFQQSENFQTRSVGGRVAFLSLPGLAPQQTRTTTDWVWSCGLWSMISSLAFVHTIHFKRFKKSLYYFYPNTLKTWNLDSFPKLVPLRSGCGCLLMNLFRSGNGGEILFFKQKSAHQIIHWDFMGTCHWELPNVLSTRTMWKNMFKSRQKTVSSFCFLLTKIRKSVPNNIWEIYPRLKISAQETKCTILT